MGDVATRKSSGKNSGRSGRVLFSISWGGVVALSLFMIIAMAWAFILGVMLGRGYQPEAIVPEIAEMMPTPGRSVPAPKTQPILKPEELGFFERLKEATPPVPSSPPRAEKRRVEPEKVEPEKPAPAPVTKKKTVVEPGPARSVIFQVGAVRDLAAALGEQERMAGLGLSAAVSEVTIQGKQWYRILVRAGGTARDIDAVKRKLAGAGVTNPIIRKK
jgi:cell division protein FtsN